ncbi:MAG: hypothetical protein SNH01_00340 [Rikenellaceae bacterium]
MEQQTNMVTEVNKIIANILIINREIYLPEIGALYVESRPAKLDAAGKKLTAPRNVVKFTEQERGGSIVEIIAQKAKCSTEQAAEIYSRWNQRVNVDSVVTIEGVGAIANKIFKVEKQFDMMLNPEIVRSLAIQRRRNNMIWIAATVAAVLLVGVITFMVTSGDGDKATKKEVVEVAVVEPVVAEPEPTPVVEEPKRVVSENPRYRVVYGVFSVAANAERAVAKAKSIKGDINCVTRPFGEYQMVSIFESDDIADCTAFVKANESLFPGVWISKRKGK